jgi:VanZ family protein
MEEVIFLIRKAAHVSEYAVLAWLAWRVFLAVRRPTGAPQPLRAAASYEWHQTFVPTGVGTPWDVLIDAAGAALGLALAGLWWRWQRWRRPL